MSSTAATLASMERRAHGAIAQELRLMRGELQALRGTLSGDQRDQADALMLKLEHLEAQQVVLGVSPCAAPVYLAPELRLDAATLDHQGSIAAAQPATCGAGVERTLAGA